MKRMMIAGNWKMFTTQSEAHELAIELARGFGLRAVARGAKLPVDVVVCPPYTSLAAVHDVLQSTSIALGAQNCHHEKQGAFTGEVSAPMLVDLGCTYVIVGHSERRRDAKETNAIIANKALAAEANGMTPILCIGETLEQRDAGDTAHVVATQIEEFVHGAGSGCLAASVIAYEPIWAIGTGRAATPEQAQEVHLHIRRTCEESYGLSPVILYGGSVNPENAASLFIMSDVDGALVGGASLKASTFLSIIDAAIVAA